jgi:hypothetical protein
MVERISIQNRAQTLNPLISAALNGPQAIGAIRRVGHAISDRLGFHQLLEGTSSNTSSKEIAGVVREIARVLRIGGVNLSENIMFHTRADGTVWSNSLTAQAKQVQSVIERLPDLRAQIKSLHQLHGEVRFELTSDDPTTLQY